MEAQALQTHFSFIFFSVTIVFVFFTLLLTLLKYRPWCCSCHVCRAYLTKSWASEFDNICDWYTHLLRASPTRTIHVHVLGNTITADPENVEHMLKTQFENYPKGKAFSAILGDLLGRGIFNVDGETWRFQRKLAGPELGRASLRCFAAKIVSSEVRCRLLPLLDSVATGGDDRIISLQDVFRRLTFDTICKISFSVDPGCLDLSLPVSEFAAAFDKATMLSARRATAATPMIWKAKRLLNLGEERELRNSIHLINLLAKEVIRQRRKLGYSSNQDLLSRFMGSIQKDDAYLRDIVVNFLLAGRDTVASALTTFFLLLSRYPRVKSEILRELDEVVGVEPAAATSAAVNFDHLREMHYVHAAIYESMRLYPPVQFDSKFCVNDDTLPDGTFVTKGTRVTYHVYAMGRMEETWGSDCEEFRPERWMRDGVFKAESPFKYPVFQGGLRGCIGKEMAVMEMKAVIVSVVRNFDFDVVDNDRPVKFATSLTATLQDGLPVRVRRRGDVGFSA
ncbi:cytochrome P450 94C1-like [Typha latifolia]|uniref:cytochrome P450 94C1-like n=1 Tax=Typha latifolia TaxID=4733 RepID=UPI003C2C48B5